MNPSPADPAERSLANEVRACVRSTGAFDPHTHLYDPSLGDLMLWGIDELLVYHYLIAETFLHDWRPHAEFWALNRRQQADLVWRRLFIERSPLSEACRGVLTTLASLGLEPRQKDLESIRQWFASQDPSNHLDRCLNLAGVRRLCMTNSPFDDAERPAWLRGFTRDPRFVAGLRIDPLLLDWTTAQPRLREWGYDVDAELNPRTVKETRRFLEDWSVRLDAWYLMVSLPPEFDYPAPNRVNDILNQIVLPHCRDFRLPFAMMPGVRRGVNPALRMAGDGVGAMRVAALGALCDAWPQNRFAATVLSRENQYELCVTARKFRNLHAFGCWWFLNVPSLIEEITEMRLELLGPAFTAQHSDARILDQVIYKWRHTREILARVLVRKYESLEAAGWRAPSDEIQRDVASLLGGAFEEFCGRSAS
jgi:hypothetical protein